MTGILAEMKMPYKLTYLPRRCREPRQATIWKHVRLSIASPDVSEAPSAFRVTTARSTRESPTSYDIRSFDGRLWWPALDNAGKPKSAGAFLEGLAAGRHESLNVLNPVWIFFSGYQSTYNEYFAGKAGYRLLDDRSDECFAEAQRGAARILLCGDVVYGTGGPPAFFGCSTGGHAVGAMSLHVGCLTEPARYGLRLPGPPPLERENARRDGRVFDPVRLHREITLLRSGGHSIDLLDGIQILGGVSLGNEALHVSADAIVRQLFAASTSILAFYRHLVSARSLRDPSELFRLEICRQILTGAIERTWPGDREGTLAEALARAASVGRRLQLEPISPLAAEDEEALRSLGA